MNRIVRVPSRYIKSLARQALKSHWGEAITICVLSFVILRVPSEIVNMMPVNTVTSLIGYIVSVITLVINGPLSVSIAYYSIRLFRNEKHSVDDIKYGFGILTKSLMLFVRIYFFTWLWSMLFVIPGLIASIRYSQSFYILADDPTKSPAQCMKESIFVMRGNLGKYFFLMLSFAGWYILATLPMGMYLYNTLPAAIADAAAAGITPESAMGIAYAIPSWAVLLTGLLFCPVNAYANTTEACFFDILAGNLVFESEQTI